MSSSKGGSRVNAGDGSFELQNEITFDLEVLAGRSKAETSYFSIVEISKCLGTMR